MIDKKTLKNIQKLVGNITAENLKYVDYYISDDFGLFIPTVGFCEYAITAQHTHPTYSFVLLFSPEDNFTPVSIEILDSHYLMTAMAPYICHEEKETDSFTRYIAILISAETYEKLYKSYKDKNPEKYFWKQFLVSEDIMLYIKKFMSEYENKQPGFKDVLKNLASLITHQIIRSILGIDSLKDFYIEEFEIEKVIAYMHQNFGKKLTIANLALVANMSESHFIRTFKQETKLAPIEYLINLRINKAKKLLRSKSKTVTEIALQCGFNSSSHFSSCFTKQLDCTPSEYQNMFQNS
ncbi:helix-turn-helix domain-containing protein [Clostridium cellulovorans]|uniref:Transcriptional regulator, AraC family n=1 Tax=Clostridium cellulovorans (strain ATCC 35296 / DSM 3052 / OCM 3 / 743B) TaxID=573061 RepID=D9SLT1_CLOC7|nr:AraC family transcriptional regulator [Clostridium cellulovorans]ADL53718.1 transcriptional regulator, AraC family [Clostridium cellulovorans 743B]